MSETEPQIKYPLHGRDVETVDGDVRARHDFSSEDYPVLYEEIREPYLVDRAIHDFFEAEKFFALSHLTATDPEVKKIGSLKECKLRAFTALQNARGFYLESQDLPTGTTPVDGSTEAQDAFDQAVQAWLQFRETVLKNPDELAALETTISAKIDTFTHPSAA